MDDLPEQNLPREDEDLEAAATLAELATALDDAATPSPEVAAGGSAGYVAGNVDEGIASDIASGPGTVTAAVVATSPTDSTTMCLKLDLAPSVCHSGATPEFTEQAVWAHSHWIVTLISAGMSTPTVDVAFSWPTDHPSIALSRGRFSGAPNPDSLRSITATFVTRAAGGLSLTAAWQPVTADATVTLADISGRNDVNVDKASYAGAGEITPNYVRNVAATRTYRIALYNESTESSTAELKATLAFP